MRGARLIQLSLDRLAGANEALIYGDKGGKTRKRKGRDMWKTVWVSIKWEDELMEEQKKAAMGSGIKIVHCISCQFVQLGVAR